MISQGDFSMLITKTKCRLIAPCHGDDHFVCDLAIISEPDCETIRER